jgi:hypothetical protein
MLRVVFVAKPNMTAPLANDLVTDVFQGANCLTPLYYREPGGHTVTATLLTRVLDMSGDRFVSGQHVFQAKQDGLFDVFKRLVYRVALCIAARQGRT